MYLNLWTLRCYNHNLCILQPLFLLNSYQNFPEFSKSSTSIKHMSILCDVFEQLNVLESVHLLNCRSIDLFVQQIIEVTKPFKLKSLFMVNISDEDVIKVDSFKLLLQKSGNYLENIGIQSTEHQTRLLELVKIYCTNIKLFDLRSIEDTYLTFDLILHLGERLNYLDLHEEYEMNSSILLQNLGQSLPPTLKYLNLTLSIIA